MGYSMENKDEHEQGARIRDPAAADGLRLIESFRKIKDPATRRRIIEMTEDLAAKAQNAT